MNNSRMIRVPEQLHRRLCRLRAEILVAKEKAQGYRTVPLVEQGEKVWVSHASIISLALDQFENHRARSNPRKNGTTQ